MLKKLQEYVSNDWTSHCSLVTAQHHGDCIEANRFVITIMPATTSPSSQNNITFQHNTDANPGDSTCLDSNLNS